MKACPLAAVAGAFLALACPAVANDPFAVVVTSTTVAPYSATYKSFPDLLHDVLNAQGGFVPFISTDFSANVAFLGIPNAVLANSNTSGTSVQVQMPGIGFSRVFTGPNRDNVEHQIEDFFLKEGTGVVGAFLAYVAKQSAVAVTDGNPSSSTALMAGNAFVTQGFTPVEDLAFTAAAPTPARGSGLAIGFNRGSFNANGMKGVFHEFELPFTVKCTDRVSLSGSIPVNMLSLEGAKIYGIGLNLGLPLRLEVMDTTNPVNWRLTPLLGISARGSRDLAGGGVIWMTGLTNNIDFRVSPKLIVCLVDQVTIHESTTVKYSDYKFDPNINQQMLKNGLRFASPLSPKTTADLFVIETNYLKDAAVKNFTTFGGSLTFRLNEKRHLTLGANYDTGANYRSWSAGLSSAWRF
jgi:hypothetical protein